MTMKSKKITEFQAAYKPSGIWKKVMTKMSIKKEDLKGVFEVVIFFVIVMTILLVFFAVFKFPKTSGYSMQPSFDDKDLMLVINTRHAEVNDIIVANSTVLGEYVVKRVIGVGGDHIVIRDGILYRNDIPIYEAYLADQNWCMAADFTDIVVPDGCVFVMGDNRTMSMDSRSIGPIPVSDIYGRVICNLTKREFY